MDEVLKRDQNHITVIGGVTDDSNEYVRMLRVDPVTNRVLVSATGAPGSGTVTSVSVVSANGFAGTVANASSTPAITLSTSITGLLQGNGTAISAVTIGTGLSFTGGTLSATGGSGTVTAVTGTTNRITSTGGTTPAIDISATFEALLGKVANPLSQFAATTSLQLAGIISDETGSGALVFGTAPTITGATLTTSTVNGVTLSSTGSASNFLTQAGTYVSASGTGTVTSVSLVTAQGVSGTVATATTTPAITLALGALTAVTSLNGLVVTANTGVITTGTWNGTTIAVANGGTGITSFGAGIATFLGTPSSANLLAALTDKTGTGTNVFGTSPTLVTPALGTPTALVGTNISGTATNLTSGITNALASATTTVNVSSATAPTSGQVLTATAGTTATWQTPSAGTPKTIISTAFEAAGRFSSTLSTGTLTFGTTGVTINSNTSSGNYASVSMPTATFATVNEFDGSPTATWSFSPLAATALSNCINWFLVGAQVVGTATTSVAKHVGFKIIYASSTGSLFATQADGSTETVSSALLTGLTGADYVEMIVTITPSVCTYYYRRNGGAQASATLTTNVPTGSGGANILMAASGCVTSGSGNGTDGTLSGFSYSR